MKLKSQRVTAENILPSGIPESQFDNNEIVHEWKEKLVTKQERLCDKTKGGKLLLLNRERDFSVPNPQYKLPEYDADEDQYCPLGRARVFNRQQLEKSNSQLGAAELEAIAIQKKNGGKKVDEGSTKKASTLIPLQKRPGLPTKVYDDEKKLSQEYQKEREEKKKAKEVATKKLKDQEKKEARKGEEIESHHFEELGPGGRQDPEADKMLIEQIMNRTETISLLREICSADDPNAGGVVSEVRTKKCIQLLNIIRNQTLDILDGIREWRRRSAKLDGTYYYCGKNYFYSIVNELDFMDDQEAVVLKLGHRMIRNPLISMACTLVENPYSRIHLDPTFAERIRIMMDNDEGKKITLGERMILEDVRKNRLQFPKISNARFLIWGSAEDSYVPDDEEVNVHIKSLEAYIAHKNEFITKIEKLDSQILALEAEVRPLSKQIPAARQKAQTMYRKKRAVDLNNNPSTMAKAGARHLFWEGEYKNLQVAIKAKKAQIFLLKMELSRTKMSLDLKEDEIRKKKRVYIEKTKMRQQFQEMKETKSAITIQSLIRGKKARNQVKKKRNKILRKEQKMARALQEADNEEESALRERVKQEEVELAMQEDEEEEMEEERKTQLKNEKEEARQKWIEENGFGQEFPGDLEETKEAEEEKHLPKTKAKLKEEISLLENLHSKQEGEIFFLQTKNVELVQEIDSLSTDKVALESSILERNNKVSILTSENLQLKEDNEKLEGKVKILIQDKEDSTGKVSYMAKQLNSITDELVAMTATKENKEKEIEDLEENVKEINSEKVSLNEKIKALELKVLTLSTEIEVLKTK